MKNSVYIIITLYLTSRDDTKMIICIQISRRGAGQIYLKGANFQGRANFLEGGWKLENAIIFSEYTWPESIGIDK